MTQQLVYTATSEFRPVEDERLRVVVNRVTGQPISTFHHIDLFSPGSDTVMVEHDLEVKRGEISGRRRVGTRSGGDRKSTRLNSSHSSISYAVFCLKKKKQHANEDDEWKVHLTKP